VSNGNEEEGGQKASSDQEAADEAIAASVREAFEEAVHSRSLILESPAFHPPRTNNR